MVIDYFVLYNIFMTNPKLTKIFEQLIYVSSVVEGVEITEEEVRKIVSGELIPTPEDTEDLQQAYGQKQALEQIEIWAKEKNPVDVSYLLEIHQIVFGSFDSNAGKYRTTPIKLRGSGLMPAMPFMVPTEMNEFSQRLVQQQNEIDPQNTDQILKLVAQVYATITKIHPFTDGNGRSSRLFLNLLLRKYGLPHIVIPKAERMQEMRNSLRAADMGDIEPLYEYFKKFLKLAMSS